MKFRLFHKDVVFVTVPQSFRPLPECVSFLQLTTERHQTLDFHMRVQHLAHPRPRPCNSDTVRKCTATFIHANEQAQNTGMLSVTQNI